MKRSVLLLSMAVATACGTAGGESTTTTSAATTTTTIAAATSTGSPSPDFPVTIEADNGEVIIEEQPGSIISLSATATEMLFAFGAGDHVVAVDDQSNYPEEAPPGELSALTPNIEAILAHEPDLVVIAYDPGDLVASLEAGGVDVLNLGPATTLEGTYAQIEALGAATGHAGTAASLSERIASELASIASTAPDVPEGTNYYHELDNTLFTVTSGTFFGQIYGLFGLENIADPADADGSAFGYPQLSGEFIVAADPDLIFLADALYGESAETVAARPGWDVLTAVQEGNVVELDSDVASRWGPRIVDLAAAISDALVSYMGEG